MSSEEAPATEDVNATLAAWRERGDSRLDPVRFQMIESLARRAAGHEGEARRLLDDKLATLMAAYANDLTQAEPTAVSDGKPKPPAARSAGPMRALLDYIREHAPSHTRPAPSPADALNTHPGEPETLRYLRSTWSRLSANKRLTQSLAKVPDKAGPLNSHHLVHRALASMRDTSPEYFHRFVSYVDGLLALDQMTQPGAAPAPAPAESTAPARARKGTRAKSAPSS
ncbi:DUF2894 domain-containing protein [Variovorax sp. OV329]|uniref:DUF2894 domain-containing protein n=1 Tax=Variovorax sp. OV329 TaxID=1882825 RepID=UPI0008EC0FC3|nr:DUF2894 domain-containing protein [Variovorax sp. OV329]SFL88604.1 Protein of unknown function [Variovorax sp. OV329]